MSPTKKQDKQQPKNPQSDEALDSLSIVLGEIAHDFNNILSLIFGYVEMALSEIPEGERARSDLEHVLAAGDRAKELVARVLTFSNKKKLKHSEIPLEKPIHDAVNAFRDKLPQKITLVEDIDDNKGIVFGNNTELFQVVTNLLNNSVQAIGKHKGEIRVKLEYLARSDDKDGANQVRLSVTDNGCGMDLDTLSKIYTPFFSSTHSNGDDTRRAGLGLTTVFNIVSNMNGEISVESAPDEGATFEITLPLVSVAGVKAGKKTGDDAQQDGKHVLFIDDEDAITTMATQMLTKSGYRISTFNDPNEAVEKFAENPHSFDVVITDLVMPDLSGTEVAMMLNKIRPHTPIILTTGFSERITSSSCQKWGISLVMNKPFAIKDMLSAIESIS